MLRSVGEGKELIGEFTPTEHFSPLTDSASRTNSVVQAGWHQARTCSPECAHTSFLRRTFPMSWSWSSRRGRSIEWPFNMCVGALLRMALYGPNTASAREPSIQLSPESFL